VLTDVDLNPVSHNSFASRAIEDFDLFDLRRKLLPRHHQLAGNAAHFLGIEGALAAFDNAILRARIIDETDAG
jgi:hypothetical protein